MKKAFILLIAILFVTACTKTETKENKNNQESTSDITTQRVTIGELPEEYFEILDINLKLKEIEKQVLENSEIILDGNIDTDTLYVTPKEITTPQIVDLGLNVNWAGWNVGATSAIGNGEFYTCTLNKDIFESENAEWGDGWRTPSAQDLRELARKCQWIWCKVTKEDNTYTYGYKVVGPNSNFIFIPAAGFFLGEQRHDRGIRCSFGVKDSDKCFVTHEPEDELYEYEEHKEQQIRCTIRLVKDLE